MAMESLCDLTCEELGSRLKQKFRAKQIFDWVYKKHVTSFEHMSNLGKELQSSLSQQFTFPSIQLLSTVHTPETTKYLWQLADGYQVESVLIRSFDRRTVCLSSQVGCPARCAFCASGKEGLFRSLSAGEIVEQALTIDRLLSQDQERVTHLVYMGMGEPFENYDHVIKSIRILNSADTLHLSKRRITLSTVGVVEGIYRLADEGLPVNLVLSLHAPNQTLRKKIIPYARKYELEDVLKAMDHYASVTSREITYEYTLLDGINDSQACAFELVELLKKRACTVNLIPYNPVAGLKLSRPSKASIIEFKTILEEGGLNVTWRYTKGDDIAAACGQLALQKKSEGGLPVI
jgi:23S rRNA (adenine2503-C2)-methyltransferase